MTFRLNKVRSFIIGGLALLMIGGVLAAVISSGSAGEHFKLIGPTALGISDASASEKVVTPPVVGVAEQPQFGSSWTAINAPTSQSFLVALTSGGSTSGVEATAADVGLSGSLLQDYVLSDAVNQAGSVASLQLPLTSSFANSVTGPTEVFVSEYQFNSSSDALSYFTSIDYATNGWWSVVDGLSNSFGDVTEVTSNVPGEVNLNVQWLSGDFVVNMSVWGGQSLSATEALDAVYAGYNVQAGTVPSSGIQGSPTSNDPIYASLDQLPWGIQ